jgi:hypothetical protein
MSDTKDRERAAYNKAFSACLAGISQLPAIVVGYGIPKICSSLHRDFDAGRLRPGNRSGPPSAPDPGSPGRRQIDSIGRKPGLCRVFTEIDSMKDSVGAERIDSTPSIVPNDIFSLSDDECVARLARVIEKRDLDHLDEVAQLIGRLAVTIE